MWGSSPRVRGEATARVLGPREEGIIPAGAGRSLVDGRRSVLSGDHPRGCGEKDGADNWGTAWGGSSPRVRGEGWRPRGRACRGGIIPAGAGRSARLPGDAPPLQDHPRGCGEKLKGEISAREKAGSSPRVRGEAQANAYRKDSWGIIPAGAGRRAQHASPQACQGDHPRGCGEKMVVSCWITIS